MRIVWLGLGLAACGGGGGASGDPCAGVTCSAHGDCRADGSAARCECDDGFESVGLTCVAGGDSDSDTDTETTDSDGDGVLDGVDNCEDDPNLDQLDVDGDGSGDVCDDCPLYWDAPQDLDACTARQFESPFTAPLATRLRDGRVVFSNILSAKFFEDAVLQLDAFLYDPADDSFRRVGRAPAADHYQGAAVTLLDGKALFLGGGGNTATEAVESYDPTTDRFENYTTLFDPRSGHAAVVLEDGRVLVIGGTTTGEEVLATTGEVLDGTRVTVLPDLPDGLGSGPVAALRLPNGRVAISGGCNPDGTASDAVGIYDPGDDTIALSVASRLTRARRSHQMLLVDDRIVVVGGTDAPCLAPSAPSVASIEVSHWDVLDFQIVGSVENDHLGGGGATLADASGLIVGGQDPDALPQRRTSRLDGAGGMSGAFEPPDLMRARSWIERGTVMLHDGSVLVLGGAAGGDSFADTSERWFPHYEGVIDRDVDRVVDVLDDCPDDADPDQTDSDADGIGDACE